MAAGPRELGLTELTDHREIYDILLGYALRGVRVQIVLRACLVAFVILVVLIVPPADDRLPCYLIAAAYTLWSLAVALLARDGGERAARLVWLALFVDAIALAVLALIASSSNEVSWTSDVLLNGFFLIPMLAATQLRPWVGTVVLVPTVLVYLGASIAARASNSEPWSSVLLRTGVLAALAVGAILLTRVQRARVEAIGALAVERSQLLDETLQIEARERRELAERVHDGALQYVLAARQELEDAREYNDPASFDRVEQALRESSQLLRSIMTELHPAVLEQSGVPAALRELSRTVAARGGFTVDLDLDGWPPDVHTPVDPVLFASARELLTNVVKHAVATHVQVRLTLADGTARLAVVDDGRGIAPGVLAQRLAEGHIGVASQRARLDAVGGRLRLEPGPAGGTAAVVEIPVPA